MRVRILVGCLLLLVPSFGQAYDCSDCLYNYVNDCYTAALCYIVPGGGMWSDCQVFYNSMPDPSCPDNVRVIEFCNGDWCYWT
jgi:hypothetical protein